MNKEICSCKTKKRSEEEFKALANRLSRIEGQVRGVRGMLESDAYCVDILVQISAIRSALSAFTRELLTNHIKTCVAEDIRDGGDIKLRELSDVLSKLIK